MKRLCQQQLLKLCGGIHNISFTVHLMMWIFSQDVQMIKANLGQNPLWQNPLRYNPLGQKHFWTKSHRTKSPKIKSPRTKSPKIRIR